MKNNSIKTLIFLSIALLATCKTPKKSTSQKPMTKKSYFGRLLSEEGDSHSSVHISDGQYIILFIFSGILLGAVLKEIKKKASIPYSPMLIIFGIAIGYFNDKLWIFGHATSMVNEIDPHTLLMVFIPGLIFEGAYNADVYVLNKSKWQILMLAGPGVLITSFILAYALKYIFGYSELSLPEALVIGSIISTTDPVAVVALLKELGTSIKFNTLLEGESLLNDGTAFVFFLVCLDVVRNGTFDLWPSVIKFVRLSIGGPLFGLFVGWMSAMWLHTILKDNTLIVVITMFSAYLIFFFSETYLEVSGILALVTFGVYLGTYGKTHLTHESDHAVHTVWSFCGFFLETILFIITGTFVGEKMNNFETFELEFNDVWKSVLFYFFVMLIRYLVLMLQFPVLNKIGYKISGLSALILSYGGLRGAIALSLGMVVALDHDFNQRFRDICIFNIFVVIVMTVMVNGLTIKWLMKKTGFLKDDPIKAKLKSNLMRQFMLNSLSKETTMKHDKKLTGVNWKDVERLVHLANYKVLRSLTKNKFANMLKRKETKNNNMKEIMKKSQRDEAYKFPKNGEENHSLNKAESMEEKARVGSLRPSLSRPIIKVRGDEEAPNPPNLINAILNKNSNNLSNKSVQNSSVGDLDNASEDIGQMVEDPFKNVSSEEIKREVRLRIYKLIKHHVHEKHDNHECRSDVVRTVKTLCNMCSDNAHLKISLSEYSSVFIGNHKYLELLQKLSKIPLLGKLIMRNLANKVFYEYQFLDVLISIAREIAEDISDIPMNVDYKLEVDQIREEILFDIGRLLILEDSLIVQFSSLVGYIRTKLAAYNLIQYQKRQVEEFEHLGMVDIGEKENWIAKLDKRIVDINR